MLLPTRKALLLSPFFLILLGLISCAELESENRSKIKVRSKPLMMFEDSTTLLFHDGPHLIWRMQTSFLERWAGTERIFARPIHAIIYDTTGKQTASLDADSASLDTRLTYVKAYGHVYASSPDGASVRADSLIWDKKSNRVVTDSYVRVVSENGDVLSGDGFESDAQLKNWSIRKNITAILQDADGHVGNDR